MTPEQRWAEQAPPEDAPQGAYLTAIAALLKAGELDAAEAGCAAALTRFPASLPLAMQRARLAEAREDWPAAEALWQPILARAPNNPVVVQAAAAALVRLERLADAARILDTALARNGGPWKLDNRIGRRLAIDHAWLAQRQNNLVTAGLRWQPLLRDLPDDPGVKAGWRAFQLRAQQAIADAQTLSDMLTQTGGEAELLLRFEGLGGNCEFGLVQRYFGVEPLGLFRWVALAPEHLLAALESRLDGIGAPEFTYLRVGGNGEVDIMDQRYKLATHTFMQATEADRETLLNRLLIRTRFLRRKLLEDLQQGAKTFVYRCPVPVDQDVVAPLFAAVRRFNPANRLVVVHTAPNGTPAKAVEQIAPGAFVCTIADGRDPADRRHWKIDYQAWVSACRGVEVMLAEP